MVKMNIRNQWHTNLLTDFSESFGSFHTRYRHTDDICASIHTTINLIYSRLHIAGFCIGHGLDTDRRIATHDRIAAYFRQHLLP